NSRAAICPSARSTSCALPWPTCRAPSSALARTSSPCSPSKARWPRASTSAAPRRSRCAARLPLPARVCRAEAMNALATLTRVERAIREATGNAFRITDSRAVTGGDTHRALSVAGGEQRYFVKHGPADTFEMFEAEADGLAALAETGAVRVPAVIALGADDDGACLILEHLELTPLATPDDGARFGEALAEMHHHTGERCGWPRHNFIGRSPQDNTPSDNWALFFAQHRLAPQLLRARANGFGGDLQRHGARVIERLAGLFLD